MGTKCGLFEIRKHGDEYFTYLVECREPKACTIVLRGASKDILKEVYIHCLSHLKSLLALFLSLPPSTGGTKSPGRHASGPQHNG